MSAGSPLSPQLKSQLTVTVSQPIVEPVSGSTTGVSAETILNPTKLTTANKTTAKIRSRVLLENLLFPWYNLIYNYYNAYELKTKWFFRHFFVNKFW
jgi:hypothetical protein